MATNGFGNQVEQAKVVAYTHFILLCRRLREKGPGIYAFLIFVLFMSKVDSEKTSLFLKVTQPISGRAASEVRYLVLER